MQTVKSLFWSFLEQCGATVVSLLVQLVLARMLAPEVFGILAILLVFVDMANILSQAGLGSAIVQRMGSDSAVYSTAFWISIGLALILYSAVFFGAPFVSSFYGMSELTDYLRILALAIFPNAFNSVQRAYLQERMDFKSLFVARLTGLIISGTSGVAAALLGFGIWALILQVLMQSSMACITLAVVVPWKPRFEFSFPIAKELLDYGGKLCATSIIDVFYTGLSDLIIGKACNPVQLGYYSQGRKWPSRALSVVSSTIQNVLFPALSRRKNDAEAFKSAVRYVLVVGTYLVMPTSILLAIVAEPLIALFLTEKWLPSVLVFQCMCITNAFLMVQQANLRAYTALGHSDLYLKLEIVKVTIGTLAIGAAAIASRDIYIVAITLMIFTVFSILVVDMWPADRVMGISRKEQLKSIAPSIMLTGISCLVAFPVSFFDLPYAGQLFLQIILFSIVYIGVSSFLKVRALSECVDVLKSLIKSKKE